MLCISEMEMAKLAQYHGTVQGVGNNNKVLQEKRQIILNVAQ